MNLRPCDTGIVRSRVQILLKSWIFFFSFLRSCINCVHNCREDHPSFDFISAVLSCFISYTFVIKILVIIPAFIIRSSYNHKYLRDPVSHFVLNGWSVILCLWSPPLPLSKLLVIQGHAQNLGGKTLNGGEGGRGVSVISHRHVTSNIFVSQHHILKLLVA